MQKRKGRYYLGRVIKEGQLTQEKLLEGIRHPGVFEKGKYKWTIVGCEEGDVDGSPYIFGNVAKYEDNGAVPVVREESRDEMEVTVHGLLVAKSPFIYFRRVFGNSIYACLECYRGMDFQENIFKDNHRQVRQFFCRMYC